MGVWSKIAGYSMMAGGAIGAIYTGGATLPLVSAGAAMVQGDMKKEGAEKAAEQQKAAGDKAIATQQAANAAAQQAFSPYTQAGSQAMGTLGGLMGLSGTAGGLASNGLASSGIVPGAGASMGAASLAVPRDGAQSPQARAAMQTASGYGGTLGGMAKGGLVRMRAPNGDVQMVSQDDVEHYQARGAEQVA